VKRVSTTGFLAKVFMTTRKLLAKLRRVNIGVDIRGLVPRLLGGANNECSRV
jgi:hypothetical protein